MPITPHIRIAGTAPNTSILDPTGLVYSVYPPHILTVDCSETVSDYWGADSWRRLQFTIDFGDAGSPWMPGLASDFWFSGRSRRYAYERIGTHAYTQRPAPGQTLTYTIRVTVSDVLHPEDTVESSFDLRVLELPFPDAAGDYIYVDPINGSDSYNGNHKTPISGLQGPKRSLANALSVFRATGRRYLVIVGNAVTLPITPSAWPTSVADAALRMAAMCQKSFWHHPLRLISWRTGAKRPPHHRGIGAVASDGRRGIAPRGDALTNTVPRA